MMGRKLVAGFCAVVFWSALLVGHSDAAMTLWPSVSTTVGLPFFPTVQADQLLPAAVGFTSTATETIDSVTVPLGMTGETSRFQMEIFEAGDEVPGTATTDTFRPNSDLPIGGDDSEDETWIRSNFPTPPYLTNLYTKVDAATVDPDDFVYYYGPQSGKRWRLNFPTSGGSWPANRRVIGGSIRVVANRVDANGQLQISYFDGTNAYTLGKVTVTPNRAVYNVPFPETNPATGYPWTRAQIQAFDSTAAIQLRPLNVNKQKILKVYQVALNLEWVTENRVAVGIADVDQQDPTTATDFSLRNPNGTMPGADNWSKAASQAYTILLRRTSGFGQAAWRFLTETAEVSDALLRPDQNVGLPVESYVPLLDSRGSVSVLGPQVPGRGQTLWSTRTDAAVSVDGQPYDQIANEYNLVSPVGRGQSFTPTSSFSVSVVRVLIRGVTLDPTTGLYVQAEDSTLGGVAPVDVKIRNATTDVQVGGTGTFTAADLLATQASPATGDRVVYVTLASPAALVSPTQYYVEFTTTQDPSDDPQFQIRGPVGRPGNEPANFQGGPNSAVNTIGGTIVSEDEPNDISVTLSAIPTAPTGLTANTETVDNDPDLDAAGCTVPSIEAIGLDWTPTALGADFGRYDIERDDDNTGFQCIAQGTDEDSDTFTDWESVRGEPADYRMRVVRGGDWIPSAYTATDTATADPYGSEVIFAANWLQDALAVNRGPEIEWPQPTNDGVLQLAGRDYQLMFQEAENRGDGGPDGFDIPVIVFYGYPGANQPTPDGRAAFSPLIDWLRTYTPYLAVLFADGSRWFGRASLSPASISNSPDAAGNYSATVTVIQTQAVPTPAEIPSAGS